MTGRRSIAIVLRQDLAEVTTIFIFTSSSIMNCCGEPIDQKKSNDAANRITPFQTSVVDQQPGRQPTLSPGSASLSSQVPASQQTPINLPPLAHRIFKQGSQVQELADGQPLHLRRTEHAHSNSIDYASSASSYGIYGIDLAVSHLSYKDILIPDDFQLHPVRKQAPRANTHWAACLSSLLIWIPVQIP